MRANAFVEALPAERYRSAAHVAVELDRPGTMQPPFDSLILRYKVAQVDDPIAVATDLSNCNKWDVHFDAE